MRVIVSNEDLQQEIEGLIMVEPRFSNVYAVTGLPKLRLRPTGFSHLYQVIVSQQLSVAAARSIWEKLTNAGLITEQAINAVDDELLRDCGLSKQKTRYVRSLVEHQLDYEGITQQSDETVIESLTAVTGIGRWTAEIYLLFSLNRSDVFAANDLALQEACKQLFDLDKRPTEREMKQLASQWSPHRSAGAYLLWAYYHVLKDREGIS